MNTYFVFCDDSGGYKGRGEFNPDRNHPPYYVRAGVIVSSEDYVQLEKVMKSAEELLPVEIDKDVEIKWQHLQRARVEFVQKEEISEGKGWSYLRGCTIEDIDRYVRRVLEGLRELPSVRVVVTVSRSGLTSHQGAHIAKWHLQSLMQRVQMELQPNRNVPSEDVALIIADEESDKSGLKQKDLSQFYWELRTAGDEYNAFPNLNDSMYFVDSAHSAGVQAADIIAGCCFGALRGWEPSATFWREYVRAKLRRDWRGEIRQRGVVSVPTDQLGDELNPLLD